MIKNLLSDWLASLGKLSRPVLFGGLVGVSLLYVGVLSLFGGGGATVQNLKEDGTVKAKITRAERTNNTFKIGTSQSTLAPNSK